MKIIFIGTPVFGANILEGLIKNDYKPILVITEPDKPVGRKQIISPTPVKLVGQKYDITISQPEKIRNLELKIGNLKPDLIVVAAYGQLIPKRILDIPRFGCLNIHPSLLPKYRGASPVQNTILSGDKETGVTIILMDEKMDHGKIISNAKFQMPAGIIYENLEEKLAKLGAELLIETIPEWIKGEIEPVIQDEKEASFTKTLIKKDGKIDWQRPAEEIERQARAFHYWPGAFTFWENKRLKILKAKAGKITEPCDTPGKTFLNSENKFSVCCGKNFLIIEELQLEGKKPMNSEEFLRGHSSFIGAILQ